MQILNTQQFGINEKFCFSVFLLLSQCWFSEKKTLGQLQATFEQEELWLLEQQLREIMLAFLVTEEFIASSAQIVEFKILYC